MGKTRKIHTLLLHVFAPAIAFLFERFKSGEEKEILESRIYQQEGKRLSV